MKPLTAEDVKDALRKRHPAWSQGMVGEWTCIEEWRDIDLLAISAWGRNKLVGYEVKVSRGDMRRELLRPGKRAAAVAGCNEFYFAVPDGLYKPEEIDYRQPEEWTYEDFERKCCPGVAGMGPERRQLRFDGEPVLRKYGGRCHRGYGKVRAHGLELPVPVDLATVERPAWRKEMTDEQWVELAFSPHSGLDLSAPRHICPTCGGKGYVAKSRAERVAPTLWVPPDVGLIVVTSRGCRVARKAPSRNPESPLIPTGAATLVRWVSVRPDPRHAMRAADLEAVA